MRSLARFAVVALGMCSVAALARGQNLLSNPGFQSSLASWSTPQAFERAVWNDVDANGSPSSGAAELENTFEQPGTMGGGALEQCVAVTGGGSYDYGAKVQIPSGQANTGYARVRVAWYSTHPCSDFISVDSSGTFSTTGVWQAVGSSATAPAGAGSASFGLAHVKDQAGGSFVTDFDDAYLRPAAAPTGLLTLPSVTSVHGANQTFFHSDVWILNRSFTNAQNVTFQYRCLAGLSCAASPQSITLAPRESRLFSDIVVSMLGSPETAGALEIGYNASLGELTAASRLYTPSLPSPTSGFSLPALRSADARTRSVFLGLGGSGGDLSQGFRSNAGAYNPNASAVNATFTLHDASGAILGVPIVRSVGSKQALQINDVFSAAGTGGTVTTNAYLVVSTDGLPVFPYVAVVDNKSGDSVWVIASDDEAP